MNKKIVTAEAFKATREKYRKDGKTVVWTNGCFDLFHAGHAFSLESARSLGDVLVVGLNSDASVRALKGTDRPIIPEGSRAGLLCALACVDHVIVYSGTRCTPELEIVQPDIYAQGGSYTLDTIDQNERAAVESHGGEIAFLPMQEGISTSMILKRIRRCDPEKIVSAAFALIRDPSGRLLLVANRYVEGVRWGLPGGGHQRGEKLETTILRECREEVGLDVRIARYRGVIERWEPRIDLHLILHLFEVEVCGGELMRSNHNENIIDADWFDVARLESHPEWILGRRQFIDYMKSPETFPYYTFMGPGEE